MRRSDSAAGVAVLRSRPRATTVAKSSSPRKFHLQPSRITAPSTCQGWAASGANRGALTNGDGDVGLA